MRIRPAEPAVPRRYTDQGSALILAMVFLVVGSILVIALANLTSTNLAVSSTLSAQRSLEYAADGATNADIQASRYLYACPAAFPSSSSGVPYPNGATTLYLQVSCTTTSSTASYRIVTFAAYNWDQTNHVRLGSPVLTAQVEYLDVYNSGGTVLPRRGSSVSVLTWDVQTVS